MQPSCKNKVKKKQDEKGRETEKEERKRNRERGNKRKKKNWLVVFKVSIISDILLSAERQQKAQH